MPDFEQKVYIVMRYCVEVDTGWTTIKAMSAYLPRQ